MYSVLKKLIWIKVTKKFYLHEINMVQSKVEFKGQDKFCYTPIENTKCIQSMIVVRMLQRPWHFYFSIFRTACTQNKTHKQRKRQHQNQFLGNLFDILKRLVDCMEFCVYTFTNNFSFPARQKISLRISISQ